MAVGIGASGFVGVALEAVAGTYVAPTKFFPIRTEGVNWQQGTNWRRVIRGTADVIGAVPGDGHVEGDVDAELLDDVLPYFLACARGTITKTDTVGTAPYTYTFVPNHAATPSRTMSVTVVRNGIVFAFTGCVVASQNYSVDGGMAVNTFSMLGRAEATQGLPVPAYNADDKPFGAGTWQIEIPTATQVFDTDNWSLQIDDSGEPQNRLKNTLGAQFIKYGERSVQLSVERDFESKAEYAAFKDLTRKGVTARVSHNANRSVQFRVPASIIDTYELGLSGVGDLVRASIAYQGVHDASISGGYEIVVKTDENVTL